MEILFWLLHSYPVCTDRPNSRERTVRPAIDRVMFLSWNPSQKCFAASNNRIKVWQAGCTQADQSINLGIFIMPINGSNLGPFLLNRPRFWLSGARLRPTVSESTHSTLCRKHYLICFKDLWYCWLPSCTVVLTVWFVAQQLNGGATVQCLVFPPSSLYPYIGMKQGK